MKLIAKNYKEESLSYDDVTANSAQPNQMINPLDSSFMAWAMNTNSDILFEFIMVQRGYFMNKNKNEWELPNGAQEQFNDEGVREIYKLLSSVANRANVVGILKQDEINRIMLDTLNTLSINMVRCKKKWDLKDAARDNLYRATENLMYITLSKTKEGKFAEHMFQSGNVQERMMHSDNTMANNQAAPIVAQKTG